LAGFFLLFFVVSVLRADQLPQVAVFVIHHLMDGNFLTLFLALRVGGSAKYSGRTVSHFTQPGKTVSHKLCKAVIFCNNQAADSCVAFPVLKKTCRQGLLSVVLLQFFPQSLQ